MRNENKRQPTEAEYEILSVLWDRGSATVREVHDALATRGTGYTTTLKLMQLMVGKGLVSRDDSQRSHIYHASIEASPVRKHLIGRFIDRVFNGSTSALVQQALKSGDVDADEIKEIRRLIEDHDKKKQKEQP